jgi:hypothetical protein
MELKRCVFRLVSNFLQVRELLGIDFLREANCSYNCLRIHARPVVEAMEINWGNRRTVE